MVTARLTLAWHGHCQAHLGMAWSLPGSPWHGMVTARLTSAWPGSAIPLSKYITLLRLHL